MGTGIYLHATITDYLHQHIEYKGSFIHCGFIPSPSMGYYTVIIPISRTKLYCAPCEPLWSLFRFYSVCLVLEVTFMPASVCERHYSSTYQYEVPVFRRFFLTENVRVKFCSREQTVVPFAEKREKTSAPRSCLPDATSSIGILLRW